jgi:hypothetical protein
MTSATMWPSVALCAIGATVLTGWATGVVELARILPGTTAMAINTAAMFLACGLAFLCARVLERRSNVITSRAFGSVLVAWPAAILSQSIVGLDYGIDWPAIHAALRDGHAKPGRMAPNACIGFMCAGTALWLGSAARAQAKWAHARLVLSWAVLVIGIAGFAGYLLDLESLYRIARFNQMAALTAIGMSLVGVGLVQSALAARPLRSRRRPWTAQRITWFAAGVLAVFALATSLTAFGLLKRSYEETASGNLLQAARQSATGTSSLIDQAALLHLAVASRPALARAVAARLDGQGDAALRLEEQSALALGIHTLVVTAPDGARLAQAGRPPVAPDAPGSSWGAQRPGRSCGATASCTAVNTTSTMPDVRSARLRSSATSRL